jgi:hypothetical protein
MGTIKDSTGGFSIRLLVIAVAALMSSLVLAALGHDRRLEHLSEPGQASEVPNGPVYQSLIG